jgi:hypothetical protein
MTTTGLKALYNVIFQMVHFTRLQFQYFLEQFVSTIYNAMLNALYITHLLCAKHEGHIS